MNTDFFYKDYANNSFALPVPGYDFPHPFYDITQYYGINNVKELFSLCAYMYDNNEIIKSIINKLTEYPITDVLMQTSKQLVFNNKKINDIVRPFLLEIGMDYYTYGNAFGFIRIDFDNYIKCPNCGKKVLVSKLVSTDKKNKDSKFEISNKKIKFKCPICDNMAETDTVYSETKKFPTLEDILFVRIDPRNIDIKINPITGKKIYYYLIPNKLKKLIKSGDRFVWETTPKLFIDAALKDKAVKLNDRGTNFFHLHIPTISDYTAGWGKPLMTSVLKIAYHYLVLQRAQFTIATQMIIPMNILYPRNLDGKLTNTVSMKALFSKIKNEIAKFKRSQAYMPFFPIPVDQITIGGQGKQLFLAPEMEAVAKRIMMGMEVPQEFLLGGLTWSATSITIRMLENKFMRFRSEMQKILNIIANVIKYQLLEMNADDIFELKLEPLRTGDDMARKQLLTNLAANKVVSKKTLLKELGLKIDFAKEKKLIEEENKYDLHQQVMSAIEQARAQALGQKAMNIIQQGDNTLPEGTPISVREALGLPPSEQQESSQPGMISPQIRQAYNELMEFIKLPQQQQEQVIQHFSQMVPQFAQLLQKVQQQGTVSQEDVAMYVQLARQVSQQQAANQPQSQSQPQQPQQQSASPQQPGQVPQQPMAQPLPQQAENNPEGYIRSPRGQQ